LGKLRTDLGFVIILATFIVVGCSSIEREYPEPAFINSPDCNDLEHGMLPVTDLTLSSEDFDIAIQVEIADEQSERAQGLMCRESIAPDTGMLFTYETDRSNGFWMQNTYVPIDILHIDSSGRVVDVLSMTPCLRDGLSDGDWQVKCATEAAEYTPESGWRYVLELPAGWLESNGISNPITASTNVYWSEVSSDN
jgi:uncharacterized membrane protein (UPF0127 family)